MFAQTKTLESIKLRNLTAYAFGSIAESLSPSLFISRVLARRSDFFDRFHSCR